MFNLNMKVCRLNKFLIKIDIMIIKLLKFIKFIVKLIFKVLVLN